MNLLLDYVNKLLNLTTRLRCINNKGQQKDLSLSDNLDKHMDRKNVCYPAIKNPIDKIKSTPDINFSSIRTNLESVQWDNCSFPPQTIVGQGENGSVPPRSSTPSKQDTSPPKLLTPEVFDAQEQSKFAPKRHLTPRKSYSQEQLPSMEVFPQSTQCKDETVSSSNFGNITTKNWTYDFKKVNKYTDNF